MQRYIINTEDGSVCGADASVVVDIDALDSEGESLWQDWLDSTSDSIAFDIAEKYGTPVCDDVRLTIKWSAEDIQQLKPTWSLNKCQSWLDGNSRHLKDRLIETGWEVLESFIANDE